MSKHPEHDKLQKVSDQTQVIGEFLEWAEGEGIQLMCVGDGRPYGVSLEPLLAKWAGIDLDKLEVEKRAMLEEVRMANRDLSR